METIGNLLLREFIKWLEKYWHLSICSIVIYPLGSLILLKHMINRPAYDVSKLQFLWNFTLVTLNFMGLVFTSPHFFYVLLEYGFYHSLCTKQYLYSNGMFNGWIVVFNFVKLLEMFEVVFVILRKKPLFYLVLYHHPISLVVTCYAVQREISLGFWCIYMNYWVHFQIYGYYTIRHFICIPPIINRIIMSQEIIQLLLQGIFISYIYFYLSNGNSCDTTFNDNNIFALQGSTIFITLMIEMFLRPHSIGLSDKKKN